MTQDKNIKLVKCPKCGRAFYIKSESQEEIKLKCPYCEQEIITNISDIKNLRSNESLK